jgi:hypothetical protein
MISKYVEEVIFNLAESPESWGSLSGSSITCGGMIISSYGNGRLLSIINLNIKNKPMPLSYCESWIIEVAVGMWFKSSSIAIHQDIKVIDERVKSNV